MQETKDLVTRRVVDTICLVTFATNFYRTESAITLSILHRRESLST